MIGNTAEFPEDTGRASVSPPASSCFADRPEACERRRRSVAQWLEHRSPKPGVAGSSPATPARRIKRLRVSRCERKGSNRWPWTQVGPNQPEPSMVCVSRPITPAADVSAFRVRLA
jgi:hypothetical protein